MPSNAANPGQQDMNSIFSIDRVCAVFEVHHHNVPGAKFKIKVLERSLGDFLAVPNVVAREADGTDDAPPCRIPSRVHAGAKKLRMRVMPCLVGKLTSQPG